MDDLSKNTLIDLVIDLARAELGETADAESVLGWVQQKLEPVHRMRNDRPVDLIGRRQWLINRNAKYAAENAAR